MSIFTIVPILAFLASRAFLKRSDTFYEVTDRMAYKAKQKGYTKLSNVIKSVSSSKLFWCNPCQTFWLTLLGLIFIDLTHSLISAFSVYIFLKFYNNKLSN
jgi:hypothetical protein